MYIKDITIHNFRILSNTTIVPEEKLCLIIGRNNTGKTSLMVLFEKFFKKFNFDFNDFSISIRDKLLNFNVDTDENELAIQLILTIHYTEDDNLSNLSNFIMNLDPNINDIHLLFECSICKDKLLEGICNLDFNKKVKFIKKNISQYLERKIYTFDNIEDLNTKNRHRLLEKQFKEVENLIDFDIIHAKRIVSSSEEHNGHKVLSDLTTTFFNKSTINAPDKFEKINDIIEDMDSNLNTEYDEFFGSFLKNAKDFLGMSQLKVCSNLHASEIMADSSEVVYGSDSNQLPEYLNGLGHMNILYLLLNIEIKKQAFMSHKKDIKLLFIEEPEAHTHPQLQYIFASKISELVSDVPGMLTVISTHSPHIVANHPFENIRYMSVVKNDDFYNIEVKNFHKELEEKYKGEEENFKFLKQYLSVESAELFFANKVIFIEGISENMLLKHFISQFDNLKIEEEKNFKLNPSKTSTYIPLSSQNISIIQVGANSKAFCHFIELLNIPTLIITDIDTNKKDNLKTKTGSNKTVYKECSVEDENACKTSNESITYYLNAPSFDSNCKEYKEWFDKLINHSLSSISSNIHISYQKEENNYKARSFEDAFINSNYEQFQNNKNNINGLKNLKKITKKMPDDIYGLTKSILKSKSELASSLLFLAYTKEIKWKIPSYIEEGLKWLQEQE